MKRTSAERQAGHLPLDLITFVDLDLGRDLNRYDGLARFGADAAGGMVLALNLSSRWWRQRIASPPRHAALWQSIGEREEIASGADALQLRKTGFKRGPL